MEQNEQIIKKDLFTDLINDEFGGDEFLLGDTVDSVANNIIEAPEDFEKEKEIEREEFEIVITDEPVADDELNENEKSVEKKASDIPEQDFFDKPVIIDEKEKVVEEIKGMTEVAEEIEVVAEHEAEKPTLQLDDIKPEMKEPSVDMFIPASETDLSRPSKASRLSLPIAESLALAPARGSVSRKTDISWQTELDDLAGFVMQEEEKQLLLEEIPEEEEEYFEEPEEQKIELDRKPYYERHDKLEEEIAERKIRSNILQKKLAMYFKKKKVDHATRETDWSHNQQIKYNRKLETWHEFLLLDTEERRRVNEEIGIVRQKREEMFNKLKQMFKQMQNRELEIGYGLIYKKSGNVIQDKLIDRLLHRQKNQMEQVCLMRLNYLKLKQMVQEKLDKIAALDQISPGFLLADFEQLKVLNQSYADKIEEKDEELTKLRAKYGCTLQVLAHLREKSLALETDLLSLKQELGETERAFTRIRKSLNHLKQQRDAYRSNINKIRNESGLLTKPTLLRDMEESLKSVKEMDHQLKTLIDVHKKRAKQIKTIRSKIEEAKELKKVSRKLSKKGSFFPFLEKSKPKMYTGRPTLMIPFIDPKHLDCLKSIKPQVTYDRRLYNIKCGGGDGKPHL